MPSENFAEMKNSCSGLDLRFSLVGELENPSTRSSGFKDLKSLLVIMLSEEGETSNIEASTT